MIERILQNELILISLAASIAPMLLSILMVVLVVIANGISVRREKKRAAALKAKKIAMRREKLRRQKEGSFDIDLPVAESTPEEQPPEEATDENQPDSAIQSILSSVFADEEGEPIYDLLLADKSPVDADELADMAEYVRAKLGELAS